MRALFLLTGLATLGLLLASLVGAQGPAPVVPTGKGKPPALHLTFGVYQSDKATEMYRKFTPVIESIQDDVEKRLGRPTDIEIQIFKTYEDGIDALCKGTVDFVRFGPSPYILAKRKNANLELIAMELEDGKKQFNGCIVVPRDSKIHSLAELRGRSFAFGDRNSTIGRYLVQELLLKEGIHASDLGRQEYLERHDKVAAAVLAGDFEAGAVKESNFEEAKKELRVLVTFPNVTKPWVARAGLDAEILGGLRGALLDLKDPLALKALKVSGFATTSDKEYESVQQSMKAAEAFEAPHSGN
ncbi:MAG TPA: PhnD/SsuA/transferrin family substrate-binding protein [Planctomycetota bacterium]|nr:PhnD/SsuA/transferrin family substrate-binding protein [Planctomycetota bacterium]